MPTVVEHHLTAQDFRLNYTPVPDSVVNPAKRHWLLDSPVGRDLLKTKLLKDDPELQVPLFGDDSEFDVEMDGAIDQLNLRDMPKPEDGMATIKANFKLVVLMLRVQFSFAAVSE